MTTYQETLRHLYGLGRFGIKPGLERIVPLLHRLGNPQERVAVIHVGGTNGKGSTAAFLASIMTTAGYSTGLFTSPHLIHFTERIRINGAEIAEEDVVRLVRLVSDAAGPQTTFFEIVTAMAFLHFAEKGVQIAVMEVGMGGRFDTTNAASGILSLITPVSLDHAEYLGSSLAEIAFEKAGIIKHGRPVVLSGQSSEAMPVLEERCRQLESPMYRFGSDFSSVWENGGLVYDGLSCRLAGLKPGIPGRYQAENAAAALCAAELLAEMGFACDDSALREGIAAASWPGRMENFYRNGVRIILDGAHNPAGAMALAEALADIPRRRLVLVVGLMGDKDCAGILGPLLPLADVVIPVSPALERAMPAASLAEFCRNSGARDVTIGGGVADGLAQACRKAAADDLVLVCGSLFTVGEARAALLSKTFEPFRG